VLLLLGERDDMGLPTATRTLITATYPPDQELSRDGELVDLTLPELASLSIPSVSDLSDDDWSQIDVQLLSVTTQPGHLTAYLRIHNGGTVPMTITDEDISLMLSNTPNPIENHQPAENLSPLVLLPEQTAELSLVWEWNEELQGNLQIGSYVYGLIIE
jgi:hypothetical protein